MISAAGGTADVQDLARRLAAELPADSNYLQVYNVARSALAITAAGQAAAQGNGPVTGPPRPPVDQSLPAGGAQYQARVLVTMHLPDGTSHSTVVPVPFNGPLTAQQIVDLAVAGIQQINQANMPPPPFGTTVGQPTYDGELITIGRARGV